MQGSVSKELANDTTKEPYEFKAPIVGHDIEQPKQTTHNINVAEAATKPGNDVYVTRNNNRKTSDLSRTPEDRYRHEDVSSLKESETRDHTTQPTYTADKDPLLQTSQSREYEDKDSKDQKNNILSQLHSSTPSRTTEKTNVSEDDVATNAVVSNDVMQGSVSKELANDTTKEPYEFKAPIVGHDIEQPKQTTHNINVAEAAKQQYNSYKVTNIKNPSTSYPPIDYSKDIENTMHTRRHQRDLDVLKENITKEKHPYITVEQDLETRTATQDSSAPVTKPPPTKSAWGEDHIEDSQIDTTETVIQNAKNEQKDANMITKLHADDQTELLEIMQGLSQCVTEEEPSSFKKTQNIKPDISQDANNVQPQTKSAWEK